MTIEKTDYFTKMCADDGYYLTNKGNTENGKADYGKIMYVGVDESTDNWYEIPESEVPSDIGSDNIDIVL